MFTCGALQLPRPGDGALRDEAAAGGRDHHWKTSRDMRPNQKGQPIPGAGWLVGLDPGQATQAKHSEKRAAGLKEAWNRSQGSDHTEAGGSVVRRLGEYVVKRKSLKDFDGVYT